jgi:hypothetical protein
MMMMRDKEEEGEYDDMGCDGREVKLRERKEQDKRRSLGRYSSLAD